MELAMTIQQQIEAAMQAQGVNKIQLAAGAGLSMQAIYDALKPDSRPRLDTLAKIARALKVDLVIHQ
jgi:DNA-binding phage protein